MTRARLDRRVVVGNLVAGAIPLSLAAAAGLWPLALVGLVYVVAVSLFLGAVYARDALSRTAEASSWALAWAAAVGLWAWILGSVGGGEYDAGVVAGHVLAAVTIGTVCFVVWQLLALAVRQVVAATSS